MALYLALGAIVSALLRILFKLTSYKEWMQLAEPEHFWDLHIVQAKATCFSWYPTASD